MDLLFDVLSWKCGLPREKVAAYSPEGKFLVTKFEFGGSFCICLEGDCNEVEVTLNLELLVTFVMSLEGVCHECYT
jgi:hypothetical protein